MDTADHLIYLRAHAEGFATVLADADRSGQLGRTVVTCPDWSIRELAEHLGGLQRWSAHLVDRSVVVETWRTDLPLAYPGSDGEVAAWFAAGIDPMLEVFSNAPTDRRVWVWGADPHARFWPRRMLHEAVVHRADLELTLGIEPAIAPDLAVDGIDEFLTNLPFTARSGSPDRSVPLEGRAPGRPHVRHRRHLAPPFPPGGALVGPGCRQGRRHPDRHGG